MAATITWNILTMDVKKTQDDLTDIITTAHWECRAEDENGVSIRRIGAEYIGEPTANNFTEFNSVTKDQVIQWVKNSMFVEEGADPEENPEKMTEARFNAGLESSLERKANPPSETKVPSNW